MTAARGDTSGGDSSTVATSLDSECGDDPKDLCAHGDVTFRLGEDVLLDTNGRDLTVSAAALYLLRTLSVPHTRELPVGDHLFPCCGFAMRDIPGERDVAICGCPNGEDFEVLHQVQPPTLTRGCWRGKVVGC